MHKEDLQYKIVNANALLDYWELEFKDAETQRDKVAKDMKKHVQSYAQFLPFRQNDVIMRGNMIYLFNGLKTVEYKRRAYDDKLPREITFEISYSELYKDTYNNKWSVAKVMEIRLDELDDWTIYRNTPASFLESLLTTPTN